MCPVTEVARVGWDASDLDGVEVGDFRAEVARSDNGVLFELGDQDR